MIQYKDLENNTWHNLTENEVPFRIEGEDLLVNESDNVYIGAFLWGNAKLYDASTTIIRGSDCWRII